MQTKIVGVKFADGGKIYDFSPNDLLVNIGDKVIVETVRGLDFGTVATPIKTIERAETDEPLKDVVRIATHQDLAQVKKVQALNKKFLEETKKIVDDSFNDVNSNSTDSNAAYSAYDGSESSSSYENSDYSSSTSSDAE